MSDEILTFEEIHKYLKIGKSRLYQLVRHKEIPAFKIGRTWRFKKTKIDAWLEKQEES